MVMANPHDLQNKYTRAYSRTIDAFREVAPALWWAKKYHVNTKGRPMNFRQSPALLAIYRDIHKWEQFVSIKCVQFGLSELLIVISHQEAASGLTVMYVLPAYELRNRFVNNRINTLHNYDHYRDLVLQAKRRGGVHRTSLMHLGKGGIAFVGSNVESEFVEIPIDSAYIDELDRCNQKNIQMLPDRLTASEHKYLRKVSNPTIEDFGIDEQYRDSDGREWFIKCPHCNHRFVPDFFKTVVRETGMALYEPRCVDADGQPQVACPKCSRAVPRLGPGEWVPRKKHEVVGVRISQVFSKTTSLSSLIRDWQSAAGNQTKEQLFNNSRLGLAYSASDARIWPAMLDACRRRYDWPVEVSPAVEPRTMGVDVGSVFHVVVRERVVFGGVKCRKLLWAGIARTSAELTKLFRLWKPARIVIDANPELHLVSELKKDFPNLWSSRFYLDQLEMVRDRKKRHLTMDRTSMLDAVRASFASETAILPMVDGDSFLEGEYYSQLSASARLLETRDSQSGPKVKYVWREGSKPDHFFLAEGYCLQADELIPGSSVFDYYRQVIEEAEEEGYSTMPEEFLPKTFVIDNLGTLPDPKEDAIRAERLEHVTAPAFLHSQQQGYSVKSAPGREVRDIDAETQSVATALCSVEGRGLTKQFCRLSGLKPKVAEEWLKQHQYRLAGEWFYAPVEEADDGEHSGL